MVKHVLFFKLHLISIRIHGLSVTSGPITNQDAVAHFHDAVTELYLFHSHFKYVHFPLVTPKKSEA